ncbi:MAG: CotH kinase family protein, partial [Alistipes sp.]|nr:CotH kinase family protein [Alistipes sp.]
AKYIELYNPAEGDIDLSGYKIFKNNEGFLQNSDKTADFVIAEGTILKAGGFAVLGCKGNKITHSALDLGVSATGVSGAKSLLLELVDKTGKRVDYFVNSAFEKPRAVDAWDDTPEHSFEVAARYPDATKWYTAAVPTPGASNSLCEPKAPFAHTEVDFEATEPNVKPVNPGAVADGLAYIFDLTALPEIHIKVSVEEWNRLLTLYDQDQNTDEYIHVDATFTKNGEQHAFTNAGLRLRGNTSRRRPEGNGGEMHKKDNADWHHCHFMLNLRKFVKDDAHELGGVRKIHLKWSKDDPTYVREMYCYNLFRRYGIEAGLRTSYSRLWIHVEGDQKEAYYGVYEMLEAVDEEYLKNRLELFGSADHNLWKCGYPAGLNDTNDSNFWSDEEAGTTNRPYVLKTNTENFAAAKAQLIDFILKLNGKTGDSFKTWIQQVTDVELLLKTYAVNVAVGMWDDYWCNQNNYYIYFNTSDKYDYKFFFIPYDYDNTLGTSSIIDAGRQDPLNWGDNGRKLIRKILDYPEWRAIYVKALNELCSSDELFKMEGSVKRVKGWQELISPYISNDTGEDMKIEDKPALSWGNHSEYRVMDTGSNNFFKVKASSIPAN